MFCETTERLSAFASHEVMDLSDIGRQLVGVARRHDLGPVIYSELRHRIALKLSLGERVVLQPHGLSSEQCRQLVTLAANQGAFVYTITNRSGFGMGETVRLSVDLRIVQPLPRLIGPHLCEQQWQGITVIGDVHGELAPLERALAWARSRQHFVWFLGDVIDYGKQTLETSDLVHDTVMHGEAAIILANHERKIARWLNHEGENLRISEGNRVTLDALQRITTSQREAWVGRFRSLLAHAALIQEIDSVTLLHAAAHPSLWGVPDAHAIEQFALYGEADHIGGRYKRTHAWVNAIPHGKTVIVGHDIVSEYPMIITGSNGGKAVFLDTGCGKGGQLSSADLRFTDDGLHLECFKRH